MHDAPTTRHGVPQRLRRLALVPLALAALALASCGGDPAGAPQLLDDAPGDDVDLGESAICVDVDGDGYGLGCAKGRDCDEADPAVTDKCYRCPHEGIEGCECGTVGAVAGCGQVSEKLANGTLICGYGTSTCGTNNLWTKCQINRTNPGADDGGVENPRPMTLGGVVDCTSNPCDPYCQTFDSDDPSGLSGINVVSTGGTLTLVQTGDAGVDADADTGTDGGPSITTVCDGGTSGSCAHSLCATGGALSANCDVPAGTCVTPAFTSQPVTTAVDTAATNSRYTTYTPAIPTRAGAPGADVGSIYTDVTPTFGGDQPVTWPSDSTPTWPGGTQSPTYPADLFPSFSSSYPNKPVSWPANQSPSFGGSVPANWPSNVPAALGSSSYTPSPLPDYSATRPASQTPTWTDANVSYSATPAPNTGTYNATAAATIDPTPTVSSLALNLGGTTIASFGGLAPTTPTFGTATPNYSNSGAPTVANLNPTLGASCTGAGQCGGGNCVGNVCQTPAATAGGVDATQSALHCGGATTSHAPTANTRPDTRSDTTVWNNRSLAKNTWSACSDGQTGNTCTTGSLNQLTLAAGEFVRIELNGLSGDMDLYVQIIPPSGSIDIGGASMYSTDPYGYGADAWPLGTVATDQPPMRWAGADVNGINTALYGSYVVTSGNRYNNTARVNPGGDYGNGYICFPDRAGTTTEDCNILNAVSGTKIQWAVRNTSGSSSRSGSVVVTRVTRTHSQPVSYPTITASFPGGNAQAYTSQAWKRNDWLSVLVKSQPVSGWWYNMEARFLESNSGPSNSTLNGIYSLFSDWRQSGYYGGRADYDSALPCGWIDTLIAANKNPTTYWNAAWANNSSWNAGSVETRIDLYSPNGACAANSILNSSDNACYACTGSETTATNAGGATLCCNAGCGGGTTLCGTNNTQCCTGNTCPAGWAYSGGVCVKDDTTLTGYPTNTCAAGYTLTLVSGHAKCVLSDCTAIAAASDPCTAGNSNFLCANVGSTPTCVWNQAKCPTSNACSTAPGTTANWSCSNGAGRYTTAGSINGASGSASLCSHNTTCDAAANASQCPAGFSCGNDGSGGHCYYNLTCADSTYQCGTVSGVATHCATVNNAGSYSAAPTLNCAPDVTCANAYIASKPAWMTITKVSDGTSVTPPTTYPSSSYTCTTSGSNVLISSSMAVCGANVACGTNYTCYNPSTAWNTSTTAAKCVWNTWKCQGSLAASCGSGASACNDNATTSMGNYARCTYLNNTGCSAHVTCPGGTTCADTGATSPAVCNWNTNTCAGVGNNGAAGATGSCPSGTACYLAGGTTAKCQYAGSSCTGATCSSGYYCSTASGAPKCEADGTSCAAWSCSAGFNCAPAGSQPGLPTCQDDKTSCSGVAACGAGYTCAPGSPSAICTRTASDCTTATCGFTGWPAVCQMVGPTPTCVFDPAQKNSCTHATCASGYLCDATTSPASCKPDPTSCTAASCGSGFGCQVLAGAAACVWTDHTSCTGASCASAGSGYSCQVLAGPTPTCVFSATGSCSGASCAPGTSCYVNGSGQAMCQYDRNTCSSASCNSGWKCQTGSPAVCVADTASCAAASCPADFTCQGAGTPKCHYTNTAVCPSNADRCTAGYTCAVKAGAPTCSADTGSCTAATCPVGSGTCQVVGSAATCRKTTNCTNFADSIVCSTDRCCATTCPPSTGAADDSLFTVKSGTSCERHDCGLCSLAPHPSDVCKPSATNVDGNGCEHDGGCPSGEIPCGAGNRQCCTVSCPSGLVLNNSVTPPVCDNRTCAACASTGKACVTSSTPGDVQCCSSYPSCVATVCLSHPECCSTGWTAACVSYAQSMCSVQCVGVGAASTCAVCYHDQYDHDGDGYTYASPALGGASFTGDCMDCSGGGTDDAKWVNPGAIEIASNTVDDDCDGNVDNAPTACDNDASLALASTDGFDYAKSLGLCSLNPPAGKWGVTLADLKAPNGTTTPGSTSYGITHAFGAFNVQEGSRMAVLSTGTARPSTGVDNTGFIKPKYLYNCSGTRSSSCTRGSKEWMVDSAYPSGFPKNKAGCPNPSSGSQANDVSGLRMQIRVPTNVKSFSYKLNYLSSEFSEWVCSKYNDSMVTLLTSTNPANITNWATNSGNIAFDMNGSPINVNNNYFVVTSQAALAGTGMEGTNCWDLVSNRKVVCGGATGWLLNSAPVDPGETIDIRYGIWDTSDHIYDSTVLLDAWQWSTNSAAISTIPDPGAPPPPAYAADGWFDRDYDLASACASKKGTSAKVGLWSWTAATPSNTKVEFYIQVADTQAGLSGAPQYALGFDSSWPADMATHAAVAKAASTLPAYTMASQSGSTDVSATLATNSLSQSPTWVRVRSHLMASTPGYTYAPDLYGWQLDISCQPSE